jgi:hypothetical protein
MTIATFVVLIGVILAFVDIFVANRVNHLLHIAVVLIGIGVLMGAAALFKIG